MFAIAALSGRALAAAAHRAGAAAIVLDLFGDLDTRRYARRVVTLAPAPGSGLALPGDALIAALDRLGGGLAGLVYGAGFEADPALLAALARHVPLIGNPPEVVAAAKDPTGLAALLRRLGIPHPETRTAPPADGAGDWLLKRAGGSGGGHVVPAPARGALALAPAPAPGWYFQRRAPGRPVSALFVADGWRASLLGFSEQWADGTAAAPYRYGGCAGPVALAPALARTVAEACDALAGSLGLRGLNSLDFLVEEPAWCALELNPRPGATLDLFDGLSGLMLWPLHCRGAAGRPLRAKPARDPAEGAGARAAAILYAPRRLTLPADLAWPLWTADRGAPGTTIPAEAPICTLRATAATADAARAAVAGRARRLLARLAAAPHDQAAPREISPAA